MRIAGDFLPTRSYGSARTAQGCWADDASLAFDATVPRSASQETVLTSFSENSLPPVEFCLPLRGRPHAARTTHRNPVIFVYGPTAQAHLIIVPTNTAMRPREMMTTQHLEESLKDVGCHDCT